MRRLAVAIALLGSMLAAPAAAYGHDLSQAAARAAVAWAGQRAVDDADAPLRRYRVATCTRRGAPLSPSGHTHAWRCDLVLIGPRDYGSELFHQAGNDFGCLYKVTVRFASDDATSLVLGRRLFDCTFGDSELPGVDPPPDGEEQVPDGLPAAAPAPALDVHAPFGSPAEPVFSRWAQKVRVPITPYPVTLRTDVPCPRDPSLNCADIEDNIYFEPIETEDEANGPRRYDFLHELGHLYEFDVFAWSGNLRKRFIRAARVKSTAGIPDREVNIREKFADAYASCAFSHRHLARYRAYRNYGWRPPVSTHRTLCRLIDASWKRFSGFDDRPAKFRPLPMGTD
jgi:hypothetical protein